MSTDTASIFALTYVYTDDSARIDEVRPAHRAFLRELQERGVNLASGPLGDDGALIVLRADSAEHVEQLIREDPLVVHGAVTEHVVRKWSVTIGAVGSD